jgi:formylglycine-generating enzyme required for sulfatase activity
LALLVGVAAVAAPRLARRAAHQRALATPPPVGMALVDVGTITVGRSPQEVERQCAELGPNCDRERLDSQLPARAATVAPFYMDVHEVTNAEMAEELNTLRGSLHVVDDEDRHFPRFVRFNNGLGHDGELMVDLDPLLGGIQFKQENAYPRDRYTARPGRESWPVTQVSWFGARLFCVTRGKRLPTDIEWEAAARGVTNRSYPWGEAPVQCGGVVVPPDGLLPTAPGCPAIDAPRAVGEAPQDATTEGIRDLGGNVAEWTDAAYDDEGATASGTSLETPRALRGGSYHRSLMARTSARQRVLPNSVAPNVGFRCAASIHRETAN